MRKASESVVHHHAIDGVVFRGAPETLPRITVGLLRAMVVSGGTFASDRFRHIEVIGVLFATLQRRRLYSFDAGEIVLLTFPDSSSI